MNHGDESPYLLNFYLWSIKNNLNFRQDLEIFMIFADFSHKGLIPDFSVLILNSSYKGQYSYARFHLHTVSILKLTTGSFDTTTTIH